MDQLTTKEKNTSRGFTYTYYVHKPLTATEPALVLCHGWPDSAFLFADIVPALLNMGHPLLVPDLLAYNGTSKPTDVDAYNSKGMTDDLYEIIDTEGFEKIIPVGHDWGSWMAQRLHLWQPDRCAGMVLLNVAYMPPSDQPFDLEATLTLTEQLFGYPTFAYWDVFAADDGPKLLHENAETLFHLIHWDDPEAMKKTFCTRGAMREMLQQSSPEQHALKPYAKQPNFKESWLNRMKRDGFEGPQCWYKALARNVQFESEKSIPKENLLVKEPCLFIGATGDAVCRQELMEPVRHLVPDLESHMVEANHWCTYEKPIVVRELIVVWLKNKFKQANGLSAL